MPTTIVGTQSGLFRIGASTAADLEGRDIADVAAGPDGYWAIADRSTVLHQAPGADWEEAATVEGRHLRCLHPTESALLIGTDRAHLFVAHDSGRVLPGFEEAPGRSDWFTPWGGPPDVRSIASGSESIYVNVHVGGILRSDDAGVTWSPTIDIHSDVHEVIVAGGGSETVLAATAWGLALSRDGGGSWEFDEAGLHATYSRAVAYTGEHILLTASLGPRGGDAGIFRRSFGTPGFHKVHEGLPEWFEQNLDTGCVSARGGLVALGAADGRVFLSEDHGDSWEQIAELPPVTKVVLDTTAT